MSYKSFRGLSCVYRLYSVSWLALLPTCDMQRDGWEGTVAYVRTVVDGGKEDGGGGGEKLMVG